MWKTLEEILKHLKKFGEILNKCEYQTSFGKTRRNFRFFNKFWEIF